MLTRRDRTRVSRSMACACVDEVHAVPASFVIRCLVVHGGLTHQYCSAVYAYLLPRLVYSSKSRYGARSPLAVRHRRMLVI